MKAAIITLIHLQLCSLHVKERYEDVVFVEI
jgi:hypothetical protein